MSNMSTLTEQAVLDGTCAVIVTYGDRLLFVEQVLRGAFVAGAGHVVLVDNGTEPAVAQALKSCTALWCTGRVTYIRLERNGGSAEGFAAGVAAAAQRPDTRHIWLLDDDNVADTSTLKALTQTWLLMGADPSCCLSSFRQDKRTYIKLAERHKPNAIQENSFFGFSVQAPFQKKTVPVWQKKGMDCLGMEMGAYGGLWFHKDWVQRIGLPDARFFLYFDDYDYTLRITRHGGALWMCRNSVLKDLESSWTQAASCLHPWLQAPQGINRSYFSVRNRVVIEQNSVRCQPVYFLNIALFLIIKVFCKSPGSILYHLRHPLRMARRWKSVFRAVRNGLAGNFENGFPRT